MNKKVMRFDNAKVIHVASGNVNADRKYIDAKAKRFDETNRRLQEAFGKNKKRKSYSC
ncbi:hypothetical protein [Niallia sp. 03133]|uniref:hypothetical protein n=1 Tax=Niallia sp. 03133 TaxID=3458060 RepID=UPI004044A7B5